MINLLPDDTKVQLRAARTNVLLVRYILVIFLAFAFAMLILVGAYFLLNLNKASAQQIIDANDTKAGVYSDTKTQVDALSAKLAEAKGLLDQELLYSKALENIGQQVPAGTIIDKISLDATSFNGTAMTLKVYAKTTAEALAMRDNFQNSPFFSNVSFQTVSDTNGGIANYPVSATLTVSLNKAIAK